MRILFIGGTGVISSACSELAVAQGHELTVLNRGRTDRPLPPGVNHLVADIRDETATRNVLASGHTFDVVVNWIAYTPAAHCHRFGAVPRPNRAIRLHQFRVGLQKAVRCGPSLKTCHWTTRIWDYSPQKIACEAGFDAGL